MKEIIIVLCVLFCHADVFGQCDYIPYYNKTSEAEWYYDNGRYDEAEILLEGAFEQVKVPKTKDVFLYSILLSKKGKTNKVYQLLKKHFQNSGGIPSNIQPFLSKNDIELKAKQIEQINSCRQDTLSAEYLDQMKTRSLIDSIYRLDQLSKKKNSWADSIWWQGEVDSVFMQRLEVIAKVDSTNFLVIEELIRDGKLNNDYVIGSQLSILLLHMNYRRFTKIEAQLFQMIKGGFMDPWDFARVKDRIYTDNGECIIYYAYTFTSDDLTCISYDSILENRRSIGLSEYYSRPSFNFYIRPRKMMKIPFHEYYEAELKRKQ